MKTSTTPRKWKDLDSNTSNSEAIESGKIVFIELSDHYEIYDYVEITNLNSSNDCIAIFNGSLNYPIPKGNQATIQRPFRSIQIKNNGSSSVLANEIQINYSHFSKKEALINKGLSVLRFF